MRKIVFVLSWLLLEMLLSLPLHAQTVTFSAVGDVFFGRAGKQHGTEDPFRYVKSEFANRDIVMGNLESPITPIRRRLLTPPCSVKKGTCQTEEQRRYHRLYFLTFQGRESAAKLLKEGGFTVMSTANNHAEDQGGEGIIETLDRLKAQSVQNVGSSTNAAEAWEPYIFKKNGVSVGIIAATTILNFTPTETQGFVAHGTLKQLIDMLPKKIADLKSKVDFVVVTLHYGAESVSHPSARERMLMRAMAQAGADLFIGTHPHVLRGIEIIDNMVVFWSLGNFLFDSRKKEWCESGIVHVDFVKNKTGKSMRNIRFIPVTLSGIPERLPHPANRVRAQQIIKEMKTNSIRYQNPKNSIIFGDQIIEVQLP
ncbi:MAG: CapA family protein [Deltaproteobacteria bacterium]|nr:CapA family protein [Deltaproteobacteria bacterium]